MINRENYEEFFLSYVDNELPAEARAAVERFVAQHPDLQEELEALLQCRIEPEPDAVFPGKGGLLQYEESFLLYVDGELDEAGKQRVEELVHTYPSKGVELSRLLMTVNHPDPAIVFPDKERLYRHERRIVWMPWLQAGVAAAVLALVALLLLPHGRKTDVAATKNNSATVTPAGTFPLYPVKKAASSKGENEGTAVRSSGLAAATTSAYRTPAVKPLNTPASPAPVAIARTTSAADTGSPAQVAFVAPTRQDGTTDLKRGTDPMAAGDGTPSVDANHPDKTTATLVAAVNIPKDKSSFATQALLQEAQGQEDAKSDATADNLPQPTGKTKLRGIFRRVTRAFGKTADRDDDGGRQVLISAFQVALK